MRIIKLDATTSTNDYLKSLSAVEDLECYTTILTKNQTNGKGQMGTEWVTESGKNLTMSILIYKKVVSQNQIFDMNVMISTTVLEVLNLLNIPNLTIKWPNDIMSANKKIGGILIENSISAMQINSIIGIGINVNQTNFNHLPKANSLINITNKSFDLNELTILLTTAIKKNNKFSEKFGNEVFWENYHKNLYKKNIPTAFESNLGKKFMGIIKKVEKNGKIKIQLQDNNYLEFELKEITMIY